MPCPKLAPYWKGERKEIGIRERIQWDFTSCIQSLNNQSKRESQCTEVVLEANVWSLKDVPKITSACF